MGCCFSWCFPRCRRRKITTDTAAAIATATDLAIGVANPTDTALVIVTAQEQRGLSNLDDPFYNINVDFLDNFIVAMDEFLDSLETKGEKHKSVRDFVKTSEAETSTTNSRSGWDEFAASGEKILERLNEQIQREESPATQLFYTRRAAAVILQNLANIHWAAGVLASIAYVLDQINQVSDNRTECIKLLKQMLSLASHIRKLHTNMPEEGRRFREAITTIFKGSMMCATLLKHKKLFGFLRASVDSTTLSSLMSDIIFHYADLTMAVSTKVLQYADLNFAANVKVLDILWQASKLPRSYSNPQLEGALSRVKEMM